MRIIYDMRSNKKTAAKRERELFIFVQQTVFSSVLFLYAERDKKSIFSNEIYRRDTCSNIHYSYFSSFFIYISFFLFLFFLILLYSVSELVFVPIYMLLAPNIWIQNPYTIHIQTAQARYFICQLFKHFFLFSLFMRELAFFPFAA